MTTRSGSRSPSPTVPGLALIKNECDKEPRLSSKKPREHVDSYLYTIEEKKESEATRFHFCDDDEGEEDIVLSVSNQDDEENRRMFCNTNKAPDNTRFTRTTWNFLMNDDGISNVEGLKQLVSRPHDDHDTYVAFEEEHCHADKKQRDTYYQDVMDKMFSPVASEKGSVADSDERSDLVLLHEEVDDDEDDSTMGSFDASASVLLDETGAATAQGSFAAAIAAPPGSFAAATRTSRNRDHLMPRPPPSDGTFDAAIAPRTSSCSLGTGRLAALIEEDEEEASDSEETSTSIRQDTDPSNVRPSFIPQPKIQAGQTTVQAQENQNRQDTHPSNVRPSFIPQPKMQTSHTTVQSQENQNRQDTRPSNVRPSFIPQPKMQASQTTVQSQENQNRQDTHPSNVRPSLIPQPKIQASQATVQPQENQNMQDTHPSNARPSFIPQPKMQASETTVQPQEDQNLPPTNRRIQQKTARCSPASLLPERSNTLHNTSSRLQWPQTSTHSDKENYKNPASFRESCPQWIQKYTNTSKLQSFRSIRVFDNNKTALREQPSKKTEGIVRCCAGEVLAEAQKQEVPKQISFLDKRDHSATLIQGAARRLSSQKLWERHERAIRVLQRWWKTISLEVRQATPEYASCLPEIVLRKVGNGTGECDSARRMLEESCRIVRLREQELANAAALVIQRGLACKLDSRRHAAARTIQTAMVGYWAHRLLDQGRLSSSGDEVVEFHTPPRNLSGTEHPSHGETEVDSLPSPKSWMDEITLAPTSSSLSSLGEKSLILGVKRRHLSWWLRVSFLFCALVFMAIAFVLTDLQIVDIASVVSLPFFGDISFWPSCLLVSTVKLNPVTLFVVEPKHIVESPIVLSLVESRDTVEPKGLLEKAASSVQLSPVVLPIVEPRDTMEPKGLLEKSVSSDSTNKKKNVVRPMLLSSFAESEWIATQVRQPLS